MKRIQTVGVVLIATLLQGCVAGIGSEVSQDKLQTLTAKVLGVDPAVVKISNVQSDSNLIKGSENFYTAEVLRESMVIDKKTKKNTSYTETYRCSVYGALFTTVAPSCTKQGEGPSTPSALNCNAMLKAAGKC